MKTYLDCFPCFVRQALATARLSTDDLNKQKEVINRVMDILKTFNHDSPPPAIARKVYKEIKKITGVYDPYSEIRKRDNENMLKIYRNLRSIILMDKFSLFTAARLAAGGNLIDCGVGKNKEVDDIKGVEELLDRMPAINDFLDLKRELRNSRTVLYLGDNAGEAVLDKLLIEFMKKEFPDLNVIYATRGEPVINDVTIEDAKYIGMDEVCDVISNGDCSPGTILDFCSKEFLQIFDSADLIIAKGQGNYESLSEIKKKNIYFLLLAKCPVIAYDLGVEVGSMVIKKG
ncbi:MAG: hypothetical protein DRI36_00420 [Caldiserica bacterium]|nr:MAG: hypothetical protein DRI36_00420 [Caldisericota bacterium]